MDTGLTHASRLTAEVMASRDAESGTLTKPSTPLKLKAGPNSPAVNVAPPCTLPAGAYYIKSNSITSVAFSGGKDVTVYTKASIYRIDGAGKTISIDGAVTLRMDAHDGGTNDTIGFTVLSSKDGSLYYSNNWVWDPATLSFRTVPQPVVDPSGEAVVIF